MKREKITLTDEMLEFLMDEILGPYEKETGQCITTTPKKTTGKSETN